MILGGFLIKRALIIFLLGLYVSQGWAQFHLEWANPSQIPPAQKERFDAFLQDVEAKLPPRMKEGINFPVQIHFENYDKGNQLKVVCREDDKPQDYNTQNVKEMGKTQRGSILGESRSQILRTRLDQIKLNSNFVREIQAGPQSSQSYACGQKNFYKLAQSTLLHELAHVYDYSAKYFSKEREKADHCRSKNNHSEDCVRYNNRSGFQSGSYQYRALSGWKVDPERGNGTKNVVRSRRNINDYEYSSVDENFAVNMEYFLTDPNYAARRPAMYQYLAKELEYKPPVTSEATANKPFYLSSSGEKKEIDFSKIYQIQYMVASKGQEMMSRWGHGMFRIIMCDPARTEVSEKCMADTAHHLVLGFQAEVGVEALNPLKGLFGGYPSQLSFFPVSEMVKRYNVSELRDLVSLPLNFTDEQKKLFMKHALEQYWGYIGDYGFLTNNCATEARDMISAALPSDHPLHKMIPASMPMSLYDGLINLKVGFNDPRKNLEESIYNGNFMASMAEPVKKSLAIMESSGQIPTKIKIEDYFRLYNSERRFQIAKKMIEETKDPSQQLKIASAFSILEKQAQSSATQKLRDEAFKLLDGGSSSPEIKEIADALKEIQVIQTQLHPVYSVKAGSEYGIPLKRELIDEKQRAELQKKLKPLYVKIKSWLEKKYPERYSDMSQSEKNENSIYDMVKDADSDLDSDSEPASLQKDVGSKTKTAK